MSRTERIFRALLRLFPAEFRGDFGDDMTQTFHDHRADTLARGGPTAHLALWWDTVRGILTTAPREHLDLLRQDVRYGLRNLRRSPGFAAVAVVALAVGIGANTAVFSIVNGVLLDSLPYRDPQRLVAVFEYVPGAPVEKFGFSPPDFEIVRSLATSFSGFACYRTVRHELSGIGRSEEITAAHVSGDLFPVLAVDPVLGRALTLDDDVRGERVAVLSDGLWQRAFGRDPAVLGRAIALDRVPHTIVGVMPDRFVFPPRGGYLNTTPAALYVPISFTPLERQNFGGFYNQTVIARLKPSVTVAQAAAELARLRQPLAEAYPVDVRVIATRLQFPINRFDEEIVGRSRRLLVMLMGAVAIVLLIGCADVASLMLTRSGARQRELAIRSALGASAARVVRQLLTEGFVLASAGAAVGLLLAYWLMRSFVALAGDTLPRVETVGFDTRVLLFTAALACLTPLVFGVVPALRAARGTSAGALKEGAHTASLGRGRQRLLGTLVVAQFALALVLSVGAGLLVRSFVRLLATDPGFHAESVVDAATMLPAGKYQTGRDVKLFFERAVAAARSIPGVTVAGATTDKPLEVRERRTFSADPTAQDLGSQGRVIAVMWTVGQYFEALGIPLKRGRLFVDGDGVGSRERVAILSEMLARRLWPNEDPIGHQVKWGGPSSPTPWLRIVGVVGDIKQAGLASGTIGQIYVPYFQTVGDTTSGVILSFFSSVHVVARSTRPEAAVVPQLQGALQQLDPDLPLPRARAVSDIIGESARPQRFSMTLVALFAGVALVLAAIGIYGVLANVVTQQTREIGVRVALGASRSTVLWMVLRRALRLMTSGLAIGTGGALAATRVMSGLLYEVRPTDAAAFAAAAVALAAVAMAASLVPAWRATRVDPLVALRAE